MPTIMITGCSSGFGLATTHLFAEAGWDVVATVVSEGATVDVASQRVRVLPLDVTDTGSIAETVAAAGTIDVLVNNAGIGFLNALEGTPMATVRRLFETNTLGAMAMIQALLPQMRERRAGTIVNIGSSATYRADPLLSVYSATKAAMDALSEGIALEVAQFDIRVRVVVPGRAPTTGFNDTARGMMTDGFPDAYAALAQQVFEGWERDQSPTTSAHDVARAVWTAATDLRSPFYVPAGPDSAALAA